MIILPSRKPSTVRFPPACDRSLRRGPFPFPGAWAGGREDGVGKVFASFKLEMLQYTPTQTACQMPGRASWRADRASVKADEASVKADEASVKVER